MHVPLQAASAELGHANRRLQAALTAAQEEKQPAVVSVRQFSVSSLLLETWMLTCSCATQARLESECKANEAVLAAEQKGNREAQVSWPPPVRSACSKLCFLRKLLRRC